MRQLLWFALASIIPLHAADRVMDLEPAQTAISFTLTDPLHTVHGKFKLKSGSVRFNPDTGAAQGQITVDVTSGDSGSGARDRRMHKEILESTKFPDAIFVIDHVSGNFAEEGASQMDVHGQFQIHGASHEMTMHFEIQTKAGSATAKTHFTIPYVLWGMKNPSNLILKVSDKVDIDILASGHVMN